MPVNQSKIKVMTVVGTRPEIIRLSCVLQKLDQSAEHTLVHTGQNYDYELNEIFFKDLGLRKPDYFLEAVGKSAAETIGLIIARVDEVLEKVQPEALLVLGDTNSCLSVIAAKRRKIPVFHMEAGNRCFDDRVPEEINRRIVDHTSDINLTYSDIAREYLISEGLKADRVIKTGSPMYEVIHRYLPGIETSDVLTRLELNPRQYFVVSCHREENVDNPTQLQHFFETLTLIAETYQLPVIVSAHPRTRKRIEEKGVKFPPSVQILKPLGFFDYVKLQTSAKAVLSDSGTISEESSILNFPALNIRDAHERPEAMEQASVMMVGLRPERVLQGLREVLNQPIETRAFPLVNDYSMPNVSEKVFRIILSYTDYINRVVWRKTV
jgi:UDP-N-acetyl-L-fucosamine synthase